MSYAHNLTPRDLASDFGADLGDALSLALGEVLGLDRTPVANVGVANVGVANVGVASLGVANGGAAPRRSAPSGTMRISRSHGWESDDLVLVVDGLRPIAVAGRHVDPGTYRVRVDEARERIVLENDDRTYALTAFFRRNKSGRGLGVSLADASPDGRHLLAVRVSERVEWVA